MFYSVTQITPISMVRHVSFVRQVILKDLGARDGFQVKLVVSEVNPFYGCALNLNFFYSKVSCEISKVI